MITLGILAFLASSAGGAYYDHRSIITRLNRFKDHVKAHQKRLSRSERQITQNRQHQIKANSKAAESYQNDCRHRIEAERNKTNHLITSSRKRSGAIQGQLRGSKQHLTIISGKFTQDQAAFKINQQRYRKIKAQLKNLTKEQYRSLNQRGELSDQVARQMVTKQIAADLRDERNVEVKSKIEELANYTDHQAQSIIIEAIQRGPLDRPRNHIRKSVNVPSAMVKHRLINKHEAHLRLIESLTGTNLIFDPNNPSLLHIETNDPIRREIARRTLSDLIVSRHVTDNNIKHQVQIAQVKAIDGVRKVGEQVVKKLRLGTVNPDLIKIIGRLKFRTSYGQNVLYHSMEVSQMAGVMAAELGLNARLARRAGVLHDVGKSIDHEVVGTHVELGVKLAKLYHESPVVTNAIAAHHGDVEPNNLISLLIPTADALSGARPGARSESIEEYIRRLKSLEAIANEQRGVKESYAIQAGRELRIIIDPRVLNDAQSAELTKHVRDRVQAELSYPGKIKITTIRTLRAFQYIGNYYHHHYYHHYN